MIKKLILFLSVALSGYSQVSPTTIVGPVYDAFGNPYTGSFTVQSQAKTNTGYAITGTVRIVYVTSGVIQSFSLIPNDTSTPNLTSYALQYANGDKWVCIVPTVASPVITNIVLTQNSPSISVASSSNLVAGQLVVAPNVPANTILVSITGTSGVLSSAATASGTTSGTFYTTVPYTQVCSPNVTPPNVAQSISVANIIPSPVNGSSIVTLNGVATWSTTSTTKRGTISFSMMGDDSAGNGQYSNYIASSHSMLSPISIVQGVLIPIEFIIGSNSTAIWRFEFPADFDPTQPVNVTLSYGDSTYTGGNTKLDVSITCVGNTANLGSSFTFGNVSSTGIVSLGNSGNLITTTLYGVDVTTPSCNAESMSALKVESDTSISGKSATTSLYRASLTYGRIF